jgi:hypothetical protein
MQFLPIKNAPPNSSLISQKTMAAGGAASTSVVSELETKRVDLSATLSALSVTPAGFSKSAETELAPHKKVGIIGVGQVGMACAYSMINQVRAIARQVASASRCLLSSLPRSPRSPHPPPTLPPPLPSPLISSPRHIASGAARFRAMCA